MDKIGTHNSGTGESGRGLLSFLVTPFARCQSKTITEQYNAGCRYFDMRTRRNGDGEWVFAHGLWTSKKRVSKALAYLNKKAESENVYVNMCYEGHIDCATFAKVVDKWVKRYSNITWLCASVKRPEWTNAKVYGGCLSCIGFANLDEPKYAWLPVPYIWHKFIKNTFNEDMFTLVDFL